MVIAIDWYGMKENDSLDSREIEMKGRLLFSMSSSCLLWRFITGNSFVLLFSPGAVFCIALLRSAISMSLMLILSMVLLPLILPKSGIGQFSHVDIKALASLELFLHKVLTTLLHRLADSACLLFSNLDCVIRKTTRCGKQRAVLRPADMINGPGGNYFG